jgi:hypothetical protein
MGLSVVFTCGLSLMKPKPLTLGPSAVSVRYLPISTVPTVSPCDPES